MGRVAAHSHECPLYGNGAVYQKLLLQSLRLKTTPKKNANVLYHLLGYFKKDLSGTKSRNCWILLIITGGVICP